MTNHSIKSRNTARLIGTFLEGYKQEPITSGELIDFLYFMKEEEHVVPDASGEQIEKVISWLESNYPVDSDFHAGKEKSEKYLELADEFYDTEQENSK